MSFKDFKISVKLFVGFGFIILIMVIIGLFSYSNMNEAKTGAQILNDEYVAEVNVTSKIERNLLQTMFNMRSYSMSFDEKYRDKGLDYISKSKAAIEEAISLASKSEDLEKFSSIANNLSESMAEYEQKANVSKGIIDDIIAEREKMDEAAEKLTKQLRLFLKHEGEMLSEEISNNASVKRLLEHEQKLAVISEIEDNIDVMRMEAWKGQALNDIKRFSNALQVNDKVNEHLDEIRRLTRNSNENEALDKIEKAILLYLNAVLTLSQKWEKLEELNIIRNQIADNIFSNAHKASNDGISKTQETTKVATRNLELSIQVLGGGLTLAFFLALFFAYFISKAIANPITKGVEFAKKIAQGNFGANIEINQKDEVGELAKALNEMVDSFEVGVNIVSKVADGDITGAERIMQSSNLKGEFDQALKIMIQQLRNSVELANAIALGELEKANALIGNNSGELDSALKTMVDKLKNIVTNIITSTENIASASVQLSSSSQVISQGASEQAASTEEVSSSMEQMLANIQQNTDNAQQTERIAMHAAERISDNNRSSSIVVSSIKEIAEKITIIGEIAIQTNILALNAAVEAARAGIHGKGFAVVASEVKELAERSKTAASEIDELSKSGVDLAVGSGKSLDELVPEIERTAQLVQEISSASIEQKTGADQVNNAIQQLNQITQQNAASAEQMATSAEELNAQAEQMQEILSFFKMGQHKSLASIKEVKPVMPKKEVKSFKTEPSGVHIEMDEDLDKDFDRF